MSRDLGAAACRLKGKRRFHPAQGSAKPAAMAKQYWLMKSEPDAYAWDQLVKDGTGMWDGVRNHTAKLNLMAMKVAELKEELEARDEAKSGNKAWLRRRLHAAILRDHLAAMDKEE